MKVYVLTETDSSDLTWCYAETFSKKEDAVKRLHDLYKENVIDRYDVIVRSEFSVEKANTYTTEGITISWNIKECEVL